MAVLAALLGCALAGCRSAPASSPAAMPAATPAAAPQAAAAPGTPPESLFVGRTHGAATAPVTIYEFSDFQCPYCARFVQETYPTLEQEYVAPGKVRWIFVNAPKRQIHPNAPRAAQFATCARRQGKFWELHDLLFGDRTRWAPAPLPDSLFRELAGRAGLDLPRLEACLGDAATAAELARDSAFAAASGVRGVPSFVANGQIVVLGAEPVDSFRVALDRLLAAARH